MFKIQDLNCNLPNGHARNYFDFDSVGPFKFKGTKIQYTGNKWTPTFKIRISPILTSGEEAPFLEKW